MATAVVRDTSFTPRWCHESHRLSDGDRVYIQLDPSWGEWAADPDSYSITLPIASCAAHRGEIDWEFLVEGWRQTIDDFPQIICARGIVYKGNILHDTPLVWRDDV